MTEQKSVIFSFFLWDGQAKRGLGAGGNQDRKLCEVMERMSNEEREKRRKKEEKRGYSHRWIKPDRHTTFMPPDEEPRMRR